MATEVITVGEKTRPTIKKIWRDYRNEEDPTKALDITGYAFKLCVKRALTDPDSKAWFDLSGAIVTAASGIYKFDLTTEHTCIPPGTWPGEIRVWTDGTTTNPPHDRISLDFVVEKAVDETV